MFQFKNHLIHTELGISVACCKLHNLPDRWTPYTDSVLDRATEMSSFFHVVWVAKEAEGIVVNTTRDPTFYCKLINNFSQLPLHFCVSSCDWTVHNEQHKEKGSIVPDLCLLNWNVGGFLATDHWPILSSPDWQGSVAMRRLLSFMFIYLSYLM